MKEDLHLTGLRYNIAAALFYIPHCLVEVPSNILLRVFSPSRWLPSIMVAWGAVTTLMCLVNSYQGLVIARFFLGLTEGGLFPGLTYYISLWYPRQLQAKRIAFLISIAAVGGAFGGIFAYGIEHLDGKAGLRGWQWIFFVEGLATVVVAFLSYFFTHDYPETAKFLTEEEREFVIQTLLDDSKGQATHFSKKFVWQALADWKTYVQAINSMCVLITGVSVALFTPSIVHDLGFSATNAQLLSVPPFLLAGLSTYIISIWSDRMNLRGPFIVTGAMTSMTGYIVAYTTNKPGPGYMAAIIAACGAYPSIAISLAWAGGERRWEHEKRSCPGHCDRGGKHRRRLFFVYLLPTAAFLQGPWHNDGLPWYEYRMQLHHDVDMQEAKQGEGGTMCPRRNKRRHEGHVSRPRRQEPSLPVSTSRPLRD
ncbi:major facilitator superfamily domain-containing protein [Lactarius psammicola]|nr:major facilitator superfamily domain-containing protein [Lactarius psammicola]